VRCSPIPAFIDSCNAPWLAVVPQRRFVIFRPMFGDGTLQLFPSANRRAPSPPSCKLMFADITRVVFDQTHGGNGRINQRRTRGRPVESATSSPACVPAAATDAPARSCKQAIDPSAIMNPAGVVSVIVRASANRPRQAYAEIPRQAGTRDGAECAPDPRQELLKNNPCFILLILSPSSSSRIANDAAAEYFTY